MIPDLDIYIMAGVLLVLFGSAFIAACFRLSAEADRQQERHIADIGRGNPPSVRARCPWPEKTASFHSTPASPEEQQGAA